MHRLTTLLAALCATIALLFAAAPSWADQWGNVNCTQTPSDPRCTVEVIYVGGGTGHNRNRGTIVCTIGGVVVDCSNGWGWLGSDGCYYGKDYQGFLPPNEWIKTCIDTVTDVMTNWGIVYLPRPPVALGVQRRYDQRGGVAQGAVWCDRRLARVRRRPC
jgi:hypothetical protein